jgi:hypothetical protein
VEAYPKVTGDLGLIREGFRMELEDTEEWKNPYLRGFSARAIAFLKAFAKHEDPFRFLADRRFVPTAPPDSFGSYRKKGEKEKAPSLRRGEFIRARTRRSASP